MHNHTIGASPHHARALSSILDREGDQHARIRQPFEPHDLTREPVSRGLGQQVAGVVIELRAKFAVAHWIRRRSAVVLLDFVEGPAIFQRYAQRALELTRPGKVEVDVIAHASGQRKDVRIAQMLRGVRRFTERTERQRLRQRVLS